MFVNIITVFKYLISLLYSTSVLKSTFFSLILERGSIGEESESVMRQEREAEKRWEEEKQVTEHEEITDLLLRRQRD